MMEVIRWILVLTGVMMLASAYMMGRKPNKLNVYSRAVPEGYDPKIDEIDVPTEPATDRSISPPQNMNRTASGSAGKLSGNQTSSLISSDHGSSPQKATAPTDNVVVSDDPLDIDTDLNPGISFNNPKYAAPVQVELNISDADAVDDIDLDVEVELDTDTDLADALLANDNEAYNGFSNDFATDELSAEDLDDEPVCLEDFEEMLVSIHVAAPRGQRFNGRDIQSIFDQHGYTYGQMSIYHCALDGDKVFSIANMVQPGTFNLDQMSDFTTPGLTLFMRLPIALDADVAFDFLMREARGLALELGGQLRDADRNPLTEQTMKHMKEEIQQYLFRTRRGVMA